MVFFLLCVIVSLEDSSRQADIQYGEDGNLFGCLETIAQILVVVIVEVFVMDLFVRSVAEIVRNHGADTGFAPEFHAKVARYGETTIGNGTSEAKADIGLEAVDL